MARIGVYEGKEESRETVCNASAHTSLKTTCLLDGASVEQNFAVSCQQDPVSSSDANWVQRTRCFHRFSCLGPQTLVVNAECHQSHHPGY